jgi:hypothetical protein
MRWAGHVALKGEMRNTFRILVRKPEDKMPLGEDLKELGLKGEDLIGLSQDWGM